MVIYSPNYKHLLGLYCIYRFRYSASISRYLLNSSSTEVAIPFLSWRPFSSSCQEYGAPFLITNSMFGLLFAGYRRAIRRRFSDFFMLMYRMSGGILSPQIYLFLFIIGVGYKSLHLEQRTSPRTFPYIPLQSLNMQGRPIPSNPILVSNILLKRNFDTL